METGIESGPDGAARSAAAAKVAIEFLARFQGPERQQIPMQIFRVLAELTAEHLAQGVPPERVKFDVSEIADIVAQRVESATPTSRENARAWLRRHWPKVEAIPLEYPLLGELAEAAEAPVPWPSREGSAGGRHQRTYYFLDARPLTASLWDAPPRPPAPPGTISYTLERVEKVRFGLFTQLLKGPLTGWRRTLAIFSVFSALWASIALVPMYVLWTDEPVTGAWTFDLFLVALALFALWEVALPLLRIINRGAVVAPPWAASGPFPLIERNPVGRREDGSSISSLSLVRYTATCPLCGGRVTIVNGAGAMRGRLVGACERAPNEHQWTFDHVTRVGAPLRTAALFSQQRHS